MPVANSPSSGLAQRCVRWFSATTIGRAQRYVSRVRVVELEARTAVATVEGSASRPYVMNLAAPIHLAGVLRGACSCPVGDRGEACKHLYSFLLALDLRRADLGLAGARVALSVEDVWMSPAPGAQAIQRPAPAPRVELKRPRAPRPRAAERRSRRRPRAGWRALIAEVERASAPAPRTDAAGVLEYHLVQHAAGAPDASDRDAMLFAEVRTAQRGQRLDGTLGPRLACRLGFDGRDALYDPDDRLAVAALRAAAPVGPPAPIGWGQRQSRAAVLIHAATVDRIVPALAATGRLGWLDVGDDDDAPLRPLRWDGGGPFRVVFSAVADTVDGGWSVVGWLARGDERIPLAALSAVFGGGCVAVDARLIVVADGAALARWWLVTGAAPMRVPRGQISAFLRQFAGAAQAPALELAPALDWRIEPVAPVPSLELDERSPGHYRGTIAFRYGEVRRDADDDGVFAFDAVGQRLHPVDRGVEARRRDEAISRLGPPWGYANEWWIPATLLVASVDDLVASGWQVWLRAKPVQVARDWSAVVSSGVDWFDVAVGATVGGEAIDGQALVAALAAGRNLVRLADGSHAALPETWGTAFAGLSLVGAIDGGRLRVPRSRVVMLDLLLAAVPEVEVDARFARLRDRIAAFTGIVAGREPRGFRGELRPYQRDGLGWLAFLRELGFGGCLADDMGLGKTVQVLAAVVEARGGRPALVVAPKSVVWNWLDEAARFAPALRVVNYTGADRGARLADLATADLVVTSYPTVRQDVLELTGRAWSYVVLDEAQAIKNPNAQLTKAVRLLRGDHRLALSGTPIENHVGDLASIFEFLNPGMFRDVAALRKVQTAAPVGAGDVAPLARTLRPFLLRRTKAQVLPELPPRTEQVLKVALGPAQRRFYDQLRDGYRATLLARIETDGIKRSTMHVLEALLRLRQAACAPALVTPDRAVDGSAKLDVLLEQLAEVVDAGHKVLVFSQFTSFLALARARLGAAGITYEYLDGQTRDRKTGVERFQTDPACSTFLISLKAGGTGLNLTAASYVYLLDPWWNPAVEAQAIDRAHRIGQARAVTAYRLVADGTIEDKVLELQRSKRALLEGLFAEDARAIGALTADDLRFLLAQ
ncbi:MAG: DEAD/DEAH box helicase [Myxococcales bacterium]|nr:DEAD/DEAH box helicase [Myxococcales bacterium]